jgi:hypothetical protein
LAYFTASLRRRFGISRRDRALAEPGVALDLRDHVLGQAGEHVLHGAEVAEREGAREQQQVGDLARASLIASCGSAPA